MPTLGKDPQLRLSVCSLVSFVQVFGDIYQGLREATCKMSLMDDRICDTFFSLSELCDVCSENSKFRPFCHMVCTYVPVNQQYMWNRSVLETC